MKDTFDFNRFGKYFKYDIKNAWDNFGLSMLILGFMPIIATVTAELFSLIGPTHSLIHIDSALAWSSAGISTAIIIILFPIKTYGRLTNKREGSDWLMIPSSATEKFISLLLITCVVLPVIYFALTILSNGILSLFIKDFGPIWPKKITQFDHSFLYFNWILYILLFTLGAICFKKGKAGKTILCTMAFFALISTVVLLIIGDVDIDIEDLKRIFGDLTEEKAERLIKTFLNILCTIIFVALGGGIFYRIKTLKH